jgi:ribonucleoside-triphosphate reductase
MKPVYITDTSIANGFNPNGIVTPFSSVGYLTYKRTYSRGVEGQSRTEEFAETIDRCMTGAQQQLGVGYSPEEFARFRDYQLGLKVSMAGRFLWQLNTATVGKLGLPSLQNCAFTVIDSPVRPFTWAFEMLMLGSGVGFNIQRENVDKLPIVSMSFKPPTRQDDASADYIVPDTREGWMRLLGKTLKAAMQSTNNTTFSYSTQLIRGYGAKIKGFGGTASGPEILVTGIEQIAQVLNNRRGEKLRPIDCLDIMNIIGSIVVAGNVRRSAQIAIGDFDDEEFLNAKRWDIGSIPKWRAMSNNSIVWDGKTPLGESFWAGYEGKGEPYGLINLELSRTDGRLGDTRYPDPRVAGYNPCAEQSLEDKETCALGEIFLPNFASKRELIDATKLLYRVVKHSLAMPAVGLPETEKVVNTNMRMGLGVTGYLQATETQRNWLPAVYEALRAYDVEYSALNGFPVSIKLTTCKPSGTLSLLPGVTPGAHPGYSQYMIRRIRISADHALVKVAKEHGYFVEPLRNFDGSTEMSTMVIEFPFAHPDGTIMANDMSCFDQLDTVARIQREWSDNAVSCTVYYRKEELPALKEYLSKNFATRHKSLSFLLHSGHGFDQAPLEAISKERYMELVANTRIITALTTGMDLDTSSECAGGACPIR